MAARPWLCRQRIPDGTGRRVKVKTIHLLTSAFLLPRASRGAAPPVRVLDLGSGSLGS